MAAFKNKDNGTWYVQFRYTDWRGERQQKLKRGFPTKKAALAWEREFLMKKQADLNMTLESLPSLSCWTESAWTRWTARKAPSSSTSAIFAESCGILAARIISNPSGVLVLDWQKNLDKIFTLFLTVSFPFCPYNAVITEKETIDYGICPNHRESRKTIPPF